MIPITFLNQQVAVIRRTSQGVDSLNNPNYGAPTGGAGWSIIYTSIPVRLAFSSKVVRFVAEGERIIPTGVMYYNVDFTLNTEDRVVTSDGVEYVVVSIVAGKVGTVIDHYEAILGLP